MLFRYEDIILGGSAQFNMAKVLSCLILYDYYHTYHTCDRGFARMLAYSAALACSIKCFCVGLWACALLIFALAPFPPPFFPPDVDLVQSLRLAISHAVTQSQPFFWSF